MRGRRDILPVRFKNLSLAVFPQRRVTLPALFVPAFIVKAREPISRAGLKVADLGLLILAIILLTLRFTPNCLLFGS